MTRSLDMVYNLDLKQGSLVYSHDKIPRYDAQTLI
jgi:hypothetical protein